MIKKLMESIREYKKDTILTPTLVSVEVILEVIIPLLMAKLIDDRSIWWEYEYGL